MNRRRRKMSKIINLTQHTATPEQVAQGVEELPEFLKKQISELLTFEELPTKEEILDRAFKIVKLVVATYGSCQYCRKALVGTCRQPQTTNSCEEFEGWLSLRALIGGAPFLMAPLEEALKRYAIKPVYAFSKRVSEEKQLPDGSVTKIQVFKHLGFIEV